MSDWLCYWLFRRRDGSRQRQLVDGALALIDEGGAVFGALRTPASARVAADGAYRWHPGQPEETIREDVRSLLNAIEAKSPYFDRVNASKKKIQQTFGMPDFMALSEILQIRRDFWAASEIFLMDDIRNLGPELADARSFEIFQAEARTLLFKDEEASAPGGEHQDPVDLRLAIAREDATAFRAQLEAAIAAELERSRFPTPAEIIAVPLSVVKGLAVVVRETRYLLGDAATTAQSLARAVTSKGLKAAAEELRRARGALSGQFATAFERAGGLAREGGGGLKRHYEFVLEAQELRARYAELLARAPNVSEKGKQFLARLEFERRAEQFRETSEDAVDWARQRLVVGIAHLIAALQYAQAKITPAEHKQLVPRPVAPGILTEPPVAEREEVRQTIIFREWLDGLADSRAAERIAQRIVRLQAGLLGDAKPVGEGVAELRVDHGSGYGVYFAQRGRLLIILLCGGDKKSQKRDIKRAKALAMELEDSSWSRQNRSTRRVI